MNRPLVLVKGAGEMASAVAHRLFRAGFPVAMTDLAVPTCVRRLVSFAEAMNAGAAWVEGVEARRVEAWRRELARAPFIPLLPAGRFDLAAVAPRIVVDARIAKRHLDGSIADAPLVVGLGPGLRCGRDCHAVVETNRGHDLGRILIEGEAAPDTGVPGEIAGFTVERVLRAPADGVFSPLAAIGDRVPAGATVGKVAGLPVVAGCAGVIRGLVIGGLAVTRGFKLGDIDPRTDERACRSISDKARAISGAVLELCCAHEAGRFPPPAA